MYKNTKIPMDIMVYKINFSKVSFEALDGSLDLKLNSFSFTL